MKRKAFVVLFFLMLNVLYAQKAVDIGAEKEYKIDSLRKNEKLEYERISTNNGFELEIYGISKNNEKRLLGKIKKFTGYIVYCENGKLYFSVDNYSKWQANKKTFDAIFELNTKTGKIIKKLEGKTFSVSNDGLFICYKEPWQITEEQKHEEGYWYIYNTKKNKQVLIINKKPDNEYQIITSQFDKNTQQFKISLGYETVEEYLYFNPYEMKW